MSDIGALKMVIRVFPANEKERREEGKADGHVKVEGEPIT